jgi:hypothetical protein
MAGSCYIGSSCRLAHTDSDSFVFALQAPLTTGCFGSPVITVRPSPLPNKCLLLSPQALL